MCVFLFLFFAKNAGFSAWIAECCRAHSFPCVNGSFSFACLRVCVVCIRVRVRVDIHVCVYVCVYVSKCRRVCRVVTLSCLGPHV